MKESESCLKTLKENYSKIQKEFQLPGFEELNKDFYIEKIAEIETDYLIREIRKFISEKISSYIRFLETLMNPSNVPMFVFSVVKNFSQEDKKQISDLYKTFAKLEVKTIELDIEYNEEKEVQFIKEAISIWDASKKQLLEVSSKINNNWDNKIEVNGRGYFG